MNNDLVECCMMKQRRILRKSFLMLNGFAKLKASFAVSFPLMAISEIVDFV